MLSSSTKAGSTRTGYFAIQSVQIITDAWWFERFTILYGYYLWGSKVRISWSNLDSDLIWERWHVVGPIGIPHLSTEEDVYLGYRIPKESIVIPNIWYEVPCIFCFEYCLNPFLIGRWWGMKKNFKEILMNSSLRGFYRRRRRCHHHHHPMSKLTDMKLIENKWER